MTAPTPIKENNAKHLENQTACESPNYQVIYQGKCLKLKKDSSSYIYYQIAQHKTTNTFAVCITGNDNAGLHSKEWIDFNDIHALLSELNGDFRSTVFTPLFKSKSRNNAGFLIAILKCSEIGLVQTALGYHFQYCKIAKYTEQLALLHRQWESLVKVK